MSRGLRLSGDVELQALRAKQRARAAVRQAQLPGINGQRTDVASTRADACPAAPAAPCGPASSARAFSSATYPLVNACRNYGLPEPVPEYAWHPARKFRADFAFPLHKILIEIDGGLFVNGGHSRGAARKHDMEKDREATLLGWRTLRYSTDDDIGLIVHEVRLLLAGDDGDGFKPAA